MWLVLKQDEKLVINASFFLYRKFKLSDEKYDILVGYIILS